MVMMMGCGGPTWVTAMAPVDPAEPAGCSDEDAWDAEPSVTSSSASEPAARVPTGTYVGAGDSRCSFGDCNEHGWSTTHADGRRSTTRCSFGDCEEHGWTTTDDDGGRSTTRCNFGDCNEHGWTTTTSSGETIRCRCNFGDCDEHGVDCD